MEFREFVISIAPTNYEVICPLLSGWIGSNSKIIVGVNYLIYFRFELHYHMIAQVLTKNDCHIILHSSNFSSIYLQHTYLRTSYTNIARSRGHSG